MSGVLTVAGIFPGLVVLQIDFPNGEVETIGVHADGQIVRTFVQLPATEARDD